MSVCNVLLILDMCGSKVEGAVWAFKLTIFCCRFESDDIVLPWFCFGLTQIYFFVTIPCSRFSISVGSILKKLSAVLRMIFCFVKSILVIGVSCDFPVEQ